MNQTHEADREAEAIAAEGRAVLAPLIGEADADLWAKDCAESLRGAATAREGVRKFQRERQEMLTRIRGQLKHMPTREDRRRFERVVQRIARATDLARDL